MYPLYPNWALPALVWVNNTQLPGSLGWPGLVHQGGGDPPVGWGGHGQGSRVSEGNLHHASQHLGELFNKQLQSQVKWDARFTFSWVCYLALPTVYIKTAYQFLEMVLILPPWREKERQWKRGAVQRPHGGGWTFMTSKSKTMLIFIWILDGSTSPGVSVPVFEWKGWRASLFLVLLAPPVQSFLLAFNLNGLTS